MAACSCHSNSARPSLTGRRALLAEAVKVQKLMLADYKRRKAALSSIRDPRARRCEELALDQLMDQIKLSQRVLGGCFARTARQDGERRG